MPSNRPIFSRSLGTAIADLIRTHAINGLAHIIGHSLGAQIAIRIGSTDPDVINSVFVSGFEIFSGSNPAPYAPYTAWTMTSVENLYSRL